MKAIFAVLNTTWAELKKRPDYLSSIDDSAFIRSSNMTFIYSQSFIHHLTGLFGTNTMTSSQLAC